MTEQEIRTEIKEMIINKIREYHREWIDGKFDHEILMALTEHELLSQLISIARRRQKEDFS